MHAKEWFDKFEKTLAKRLVAERKKGATWKSLERKFGLPDNSGMAAYRVYCWSENVAKPPSARLAGGGETVAFTLDEAARQHLKHAKMYYRTTASQALRKVLAEWAGRHRK